MSLEELAQTLKGQNKLLLGCKGRVYDVTENQDMYGPDAGYHLFIGKDSSVALAKMDFNDEYMDPAQLHWKRNLNETELTTLDEWVEKFDGKYPVVAYIKDDGVVAH